MTTYAQLLHPEPEGILVPPVWACFFLGWTPAEVREAFDPADPEQPRLFNSAERAGRRLLDLADILVFFGAMADSGLIPGPTEEPPF